MNSFSVRSFHHTRIATKDICRLSKKINYIPAFLEFDVTDSRIMLRQFRRKNGNISFTSWLIKVIALTLSEYKEVAAFSQGKQKLVVYDNINVSVAIEKEINGNRVPIPLVIEKADTVDLIEINTQIDSAVKVNLEGDDIVLNKKSNRGEKIYSKLPRFLRMMFWNYFIRHPHYAFKKSGNVAFTSVAMMGKANGWFMPLAIHPVCFGVGSISKKAAAFNNSVEIREIMNMTVLFNHDVVDGAIMARFISKLSENIVSGKGLES